MKLGWLKLGLKLGPVAMGILKLGLKLEILKPGAVGIVKCVDGVFALGIGMNAVVVLWEGVIVCVVVLVIVFVTNLLNSSSTSTYNSNCESVLSPIFW